MENKNKLKNYLNLALVNSGSLFVLKIFGIGLNYLVLLSILYFYDYSGNGEYANFLIQSTAIKVIVVFGLDYLLIKDINKKDVNKLKLAFEYLIALLYNIVFFILAFLLLSFIFKLNFQLMFGVIILAFWRFVSHFFRAKNNMRLYGFFEFIIIQITVLFSIFISKYIYSSISFIDVFLILNIISVLFFIVYILLKIYNKYSIHYIKSAVIKVYKKLFVTYNRAFHFVLTNSTNIISVAIVYYFISVEYSKETLGIYDTIVRFSQVLTLPLIATNGRVIAIAAKFYNNKELEQLKQYVINITKMLMYSSSLLFLMLICFFYLFSTYYSSTLKDYWLLFILLSIAQLINNWAGPVGVVLQATDNEKSFNKITIIAALFLLISTVVFTSILPITVIGGIIIFQIIIINFLALRVQKKKLGINPYIT